MDIQLISWKSLCFKIQK